MLPKKRFPLPFCPSTCFALFTAIVTAFASSFVSSAASARAQSSSARDTHAPETSTLIEGQFLVEFEAPACGFPELRGVEAAESARRLDAWRASADERMLPRIAALEALGVDVLRSYWIVECLSVRADPEQIEAIRGMPIVKRVWQDRLHQAHSGRVVMPIRDSTNAANHGTDIVQRAGVLGQGALLAAFDSGLDAKHASTQRPHRAFYVGGNPRDNTGGGLAGSRLLANRQAGLLSPENALTHGTLVAGIAAGEVWGTAAADRGHAPRAQVRGYSIVDNVRGGASYASVLNAWQMLAADKDTKPLVVMVAYGGSPDPLHPTQAALDRAAIAMDALVVVSAGNGGASTLASQAAVNGLSVGATHGQGSKRMWAYSSRGPLAALPKGYYPSLVANGVNIVGPRADAEDKDEADTGSSMAAAQVAGTATFLRGFAPRLSALQCKAALLASVDDIRARNTGLDRNAFGLGYLRADKLLSGVRAAPVLVSSTLTSSTRVREYRWATARNAAWSLACVWNRMALDKVAFGDLAVDVYLGNRLLAQSDEAQMNVEALRFRSPEVGTLRVVVRAKSSDAAILPFALCVMPTVLPYSAGGFAGFGKACASSVAASDVAAVVPPSAGRVMQASQSRYIASGLPLRLQVLVDASLLPAKIEVDGIAFRQDDSAPLSPLRGVTFQGEVVAGYGANPLSAISGTFARNVTRGSLVMADRKILMPDFVVANRTPSRFDVRMPFDRPFTFDAQSGSPLVIELRSKGASVRTTYLTDAVDLRNSESSRLATVYAPSMTATTGSIFRRYAPVLALTTKSSVARRSPQLWGTGVPDVGAQFRLEYSDFTPNSIAVFSLGFSATNWGAFALPFDMSPFGAAGCSISSSVDFSTALVVGANGHGTIPLALPANRDLIGVVFYVQMACFDALANRFGVYWSGGVKVSVGG